MCSPDRFPNGELSLPFGAWSLSGRSFLRFSVESRSFCSDFRRICRALADLRFVSVETSQFSGDLSRAQPSSAEFQAISDEFRRISVEFQSDFSRIQVISDDFSRISVEFQSDSGQFRRFQTISVEFQSDSGEFRRFSVIFGQFPVDSGDSGDFPSLPVAIGPMSGRSMVELRTFRPRLFVVKTFLLDPGFDAVST